MPVSVVVCSEWPRGDRHSYVDFGCTSMGQRWALMLKGVVERLVEIELILQISKSMYYWLQSIFIVVSVCQDVDKMRNIRLYLGMRQSSDEEVVFHG